MRGGASLIEWLAAASVVGALCHGVPAMAEQEGSDADRVVIDILAPEPTDSQPDPLEDQWCEEEADAGRVAGEIVVCRSLRSVTDGVYDHETFLRRYAEVTQGPEAPDVDGSGLPFGMKPIIEVAGCFIPPCPTAPALLIDVGKLPDAPVGSDADRLALGLAAQGDESDLTGEQRRALQAELGLPPSRYVGYDAAE